MREKIATLKEKLAGGVTPAMATPLKPDSYLINEDVVPPLVDFLISKGVRGLFPGGTTGEGVALDVSERKKLLELTAAAVDGRVPILAHVGAIRVDTAVDLARHAAQVGSDAIVAVTPYFYGMNDKGLAAYFTAIAAAVPEIPIFVYDIPHMAVNGISPGLVAHLVAALPSFAGCKSSNADLQAVRRLIDALPDELLLLAGNESVALGSLALGADGMISGLSTAVPEPFVTLTHAFAHGDIEGARQMQQAINKLLQQIPAGERLGAIKSILNSRGIPVGRTGPTLPYPEEDIWLRMKPILSQ